MYGIAASLLTFLSLIIYKLAEWVLDTWGLLSIDEIIFHLEAPLEGTNTDVMIEGVNACLPMATLVGMMIITFTIGMRKKKLISGICVFLIMCISLGTGAYAVDTAYRELNVEEYIESQKEYTTFVEDEYVDPRSVELTFPEQKRNLIYIYLESMEATYFSVEEGGAFEENCIPELAELAQMNVSFSNTDKLGGIFTTVGSTWTMAAIFSQTTGLPLKNVDSNEANTVLTESTSFSSSICNLEDILYENGYQQCFMLGSDATFGGRRAYFNSHGECEIWDYLTAKEEGKIHPDYYVWWGYEDFRLFRYAQSKLEELSESGEPFNLTLLTVDTHFADGYVCELCQNEFGDNQYANVMACSSRLVKEFIEWVQQQPFYENTTIILCGDHLTMDGDFCEGIEDYERGVFNAFINLPEGLDTANFGRPARRFRL